MITVFCRRLSWHHLAVLLEGFQSRLTFGVQQELVDLVRLPLLTGFRARMFFDCGLQTVAQVAAAEICDVEKVLSKAVPFQR
jgi:DNA polymerase theta